MTAIAHHPGDRSPRRRDPRGDRPRLAVPAAAEEPDRRGLAWSSSRWSSLVAIFAPLLAPHDPNTRLAQRRPGPPERRAPARHRRRPATTSSSRLLYAARLSLAGALIALVVALRDRRHRRADRRLLRPAGSTARRPGWPACSWRCPRIVVLLAARAVLGPSIWPSMVDLRRPDRPGVLPARVRPRSPRCAHELYVDAARVSGPERRAGSSRRHILTVVARPDHHPGRRRSPASRSPSRPAGLPRPRRPEQAHLGRDAQRRLRQHLHRAARCCCGPAWRSR